MVFGTRKPVLNPWARTAQESKIVSARSRDSKVVWLEGAGLQGSQRCMKESQKKKEKGKEKGRAYQHDRAIQSREISPHQSRNE